MEAKSKVFGFVAVAALTLSMGVGIVSAKSSIGTGTVETVPGDCVYILNGSSDLDFDFGEWTWNGLADRYDPPANDADREDSASIRIYGPTPQGGTCWATIDAELRAGDHSIDSGHFRAGRTQAQVRGTGAWTVPTSQEMNFSGKFTNQTFWLRLNSVPNTIAADEYTGTITVTVSNDQPGS